MNGRKFVAATALSLALLSGVMGVVTADRPGELPNNACYGQHVSMMARDFGGMRAATEQMHGGWTVGEHMDHMRSGEMPVDCPMDHMVR